MRADGFHPSIWIDDALRAGLMPSQRAYLVARIISGAVDVDGRWCYLFVDTVSERTGGLASASTVKRGLADLVRAGLVRKLAPEEARRFFAEVLAARRRYGDRLPAVLELMVPARAYPALVLEQINRQRAVLGEEPLTVRSRPGPATSAAGQIDTGGVSDRSADPSPIPPLYDEAARSVRGSDTTGRAKARETAEAHALEAVADIPDRALRDPGADRAALARAVERLAQAGLDASALSALLSGADTLIRPFPALIRRLADPRSAREFLDGRLGAGVHRPRGPLSIPLPRVPYEGGGDVFDHPPAFEVDASGTAPRTCPEHPGVRNVPGGRCRACQGSCRSVPGELLHPERPTARPARPSEPEPFDGSAPVSGATTDTGGATGPGVGTTPGIVAQVGTDTAPGAGTSADAQAMQVDPVLVGRLRASLAEAAAARGPEPPEDGPGDAHSPGARAAIDGVRGLLRRRREEYGRAGQARASR
ncbi:hypothetical protein [Nocardiopsis sp. NRRL B-16309]|uniref:hypothetical protein n=1 Tax=Nocardiopsis sp. NRRL B-16309 TaxID=1519494 RepID=UPI0006AFFEDE|nr:hypothetical protein [Nocardiopsis sp. NRRL B-16309]